MLARSDASNDCYVRQERNSKLRRKGGQDAGVIDIGPCKSYANLMDVNLSDDQRAFVRQAIAAGRFDREEDAVREALALWEERERVRAELLTAIHSADVSLAQGGGRPISEASMRELASEVKRRGRARLERERQGSSH